jgi:hypothetical protein
MRCDNTVPGERGRVNRKIHLFPGGQFLVEDYVEKRQAP